MKTLTYAFIILMSIGNIQADDNLASAVDTFIKNTADYASKSAYNPSYTFKQYERESIVESFQDVLPHINILTQNLKGTKAYLSNGKKKKYVARTQKFLRSHSNLHANQIKLINYAFMAGDSFTSVLSEDFDISNYDGDNFQDMVKSIISELRYTYTHRTNQSKNHQMRKKKRLTMIRYPSMVDFLNGRQYLNKYLVQESNAITQQEAIAILQNLENFESSIQTFDQVSKNVNWKTGKYNIFYKLKVTMLKALSYVSIPKKHKISSSYLNKAEQEFEPGDIGAIQRYGKLSNIVFKGNWTHGLLYIGQYSKLDKYFSSDDETTNFYRNMCLSRSLNCSNFTQYLHEAYPQKMQEYIRSEIKGKPFVTIEGLKPGIIFMEAGASMAWDNLVILRPNLRKMDKAMAIERAFKSLGKKYDYDFNGRSYSRFVCTELIQYAYEDDPRIDKNGLEWDVNMVFGKPAMYGFDLVKTYVNDMNSKEVNKKLDLVIYLKGVKSKNNEFGRARRGSFKELVDTL